MFAVFGTMVSTFFIGGMLFLFGLLPIYDALIFGSLISDVDPVAAIAIFQALNVDPTLSSLVFGESLLNDAVSIVLFRTFMQFAVSSNFTIGAIGKAIQHFVVTFFGSIVIGVVVALVAAIVGNLF
jgi:sodium/hydrogen exchanger 8